VREPVFESHSNASDESTLFQGSSATLIPEFQRKFQNITQILDCLGCDRCKLWGKLQTQGIAAALKILLAADDEPLELAKTEIIALMNTLNQVSMSVEHVSLAMKNSTRMLGENDGARDMDLLPWKSSDSVSSIKHASNVANQSPHASEL